MNNVISAVIIGASIFTAGGMIAWHDVRPLNQMEQAAVVEIADNIRCSQASEIILYASAKGLRSRLVDRISDYCEREGR